MGIPLKGPDVNISRQEQFFSIFHQPCAIFLSSAGFFAYKNARTPAILPVNKK